MFVYVFTNNFLKISRKIFTKFKNNKNKIISLTYLSLWSIQISDISVLANLTALRELDLSNNQISDINALFSLVNATTIILVANEAINCADLDSLEATVGAGIITRPSSCVTGSTINIVGTWNYSGYYENCLNTPAQGIMVFSENNITVSGEDWHHNCTVSNINEALPHSLSNLSSVTLEEFKSVLAISYSTPRFEIQNTRYTENHMNWRIVDSYDGSVEILEINR